MQYEMITRPGPRAGRCRSCGKEDDDMALGVCFNCADSGERRAAQRTVLQHLSVAVVNARQGAWFEMRCDLEWAWGRATRTGDYAPGGYFESQGHL